MNILIIDKSEVFSLGLLNSILKLNIFKNINTIQISTQFNSKFEDIDDLGVLLIDYSQLEDIKTVEKITRVKNINSKIKVIIYTDFLNNLNFDKLIGIQPNGLFSKSISKVNLKNYLKRVVRDGTYIDFEMIKSLVNLELESKYLFDKKFKLKQSYYLIHSLERKLNFVNHQYESQIPLISI